MATFDILCDMCNGNGVTKHAQNWCPVCEEGFCSECLKPHSKMKVTRDHKVISIDNYTKLPQSLPKLSHQCDEHSKDYLKFCPDHECLCCPVCKHTSHSHNECSELMSMGEAVKTSVSLEVLELALSNIETNIKMAQTDREQNISNIIEQGQQFHSEIKTLRSMINSHLDEIEEHFDRELNSEEDLAKSHIQNILTKISETSGKIEVLKHNLLAAKECGSDMQTFFWKRTLEAEIRKEDDFLKSLSQDGSLQQFSLHLEIDPKMSDLSFIQVYGTISTQINSQSVAIKTDNITHAQNLYAVGESIPKSINDINLVLKSEFKVDISKESLRVYGSTICRNGKIIFTDPNNTRLIVMNDNCTFQKEITDIEWGPNDITEIDDTTVAVTTNRDILIVDLDTEKIKEMINIGDYCFGIVHQDGRLFWCQLSKGVQMIELSSMNISNIVGKKEVYFWSYIAINGEHLYVTNMNAHVVTCFNIRGEKIWDCRNQAIYIPRCLSLDSDSNIYIVSEGHKSIIVISPNGKECRTLVSLKDITGQLWGLSCNKARNNLLVSLTDGSAFLYNFFWSCFFSEIRFDLIQSETSLSIMLK